MSARPMVPRASSPDVTARLMLVVLSLGWGVSWSTMRIALIEMPPFSMRVATMLIGAVALGVMTALRRCSFALRTPVAAAHVVAASFFNIIGFSVCTPFAQLYAATSRVTILVYTMPIWAALLARIALGERITPVRAAALALCVAGMVVLIGPLVGAGVPLGIVLALGAAVSWAAGTVYLKWAHIDADPMAVTFWQLFVGFLVVALCALVFEGTPRFWPLRIETLLAVVFSGLVGSGIAYFLWFDIVRRVPAMTASLGVLSVPPVGVLGAVVLLGERPTLTDIAGFALILLASACVLVAPGLRRRRRARAD